MHNDAQDDKPPDDRYIVTEAMPGKGQAVDIANAALFLGSDFASRITCVTLPVDGGYLAKP